MLPAVPLPGSRSWPCCPSTVRLGALMLGCAMVLTSPHGLGAEEQRNAAAGGTLTLERHATSNALDAELALFDWYTVLRGRLEREFEIGATALTLAVEGNAAIFDTYDIEDDASVTVSARAGRTLGEHVELRGTLSYTIATEGDDLDIGGVIIGIRTAEQTARAALEMGIDLGSQTTLVLAASAAREVPQPTLFEAGIFEPALLSPATDRFGASARLARQWGAWIAAANLSAEWVDAGSPGMPPYDFRLARRTGLLEAAWTSPGGAKLRAAAGVDRLAALDGVISELRPAYTASIDWPFRGGLELRAAVSAGFDTVDGDDPVASWLRRIEFEASKAIGGKLVVAGGVFSGRRENLSLLTTEHSQGFYVEASRPFGRHVTGVVRVDASRRHETVIEAHIRGIDIFVGLTGKL